MGLIKIVCLALVFSFANVKTMRNTYFSAAQNEELLGDFQKTINNYKKSDQLYYCYLSAFYSLESKFASGLSKKLEFFKSSKTYLEKSLSIKETLDAHFIRFCIQTNAPSILNYKSEIPTDKKYILNHLKNESDQEFKQKIKEFLLASKEVSKTEKESLKNI